MLYSNLLRITGQISKFTTNYIRRQETKKNIAIVVRLATKHALHTLNNVLFGTGIR